MRDRLELARWLLANGGAVSVPTVLAEVRGAEANRLRLDARAATPEPGVAALVTTPGGEGLVLPLRVELGASRLHDPEARAASELAHRLVADWLGTPLPPMRFAMEERFDLAGASLGLPAFLAFAFRATARAPDAPILATGRLDSAGQVLPVEGLDAKLAVIERVEHARVFVGATQATPHARGVARVRALADELFGTAAASPELLRVSDAIARMHQTPDDPDHLRVLEALDRDTLPRADRLVLALHRVQVLRHLGRADEALSLLAETETRFGGAEQALGSELRERLELEPILVAIDRFELEEAEARLRRRLDDPFASLLNELRVRGMLAQVVAMQGRHTEAVALRTQNLALHDLSEHLDRTRVGTLCYLALDSALSGDATAFEHHARAALERTAPSDERQGRYTAAAVVRGLVALERDDEALAWAREQRPWASHPPPSAVAWVRTDSPIRTHPEVSIVRALAAAARRVGDAAWAERFVDRVVVEPQGPNDLVAWLAGLVWVEAGRVVELEAIHPSATASPYPSWY